MPAPSTGLTRITVVSPQRRVDVVLPDHVPIADLLPELLARAGDGLADEGERHGGWLLRRVDGGSVPATASLATAEVRDGEVLHLVPALAEWPEPEYDDVVEAVAAQGRRLGAPWSGDATRIAAVAVAGAVVAAGVSDPLGRLFDPSDGGRWTALGVAALFLAAGVVAARAYGESLVGAALAAYAMPLAFVGGLRVVGPDPGSSLLVGAVALTVCAVAGALGAGTGLWIFVAGATAGVLAAGTALAALVTGVPEAAALTLVAVVVGVALTPLLAVRLGRLPMPVVAVPGGSDAAGLGERPEPGRVAAAVDRGDAMLTGLLCGLGLVAVGAGPVAQEAGVAGVLLVLMAGVALLLRSRLYVTVRQRIPLLAAGTGLLVLLLPRAGEVAGPAAGPVLALLAVGIAAGGARYRRRLPSPYLGRAADVVELLCLVSMLPAAAAALGLYARMRGLAG